MFLLQAPEVRELELFTSMPEPLRRPERSAWADANRGGAVTDSFLEGPVFDGAGNLLIVDSYNQRVRRVDRGTGRISTVAGRNCASPTRPRSKGSPVSA